MPVNAHGGISASNGGSSAVSGIAASNLGSAPASITLTGTAQGGSGAAIKTSSAAGNLTTITLASGAAANAGASGIAISNNEGNSLLTLASGASITGEVRLGAGSDTAILNGANALAGISVLDGGADVDALTLSGMVGTIASGDGIRLVEFGGISQAGALSLAGGAIDVGAFSYGLFNGGIAYPADQDWYLRSRIRDIVVPTITTARLAEDISLAALGTLNGRIGEAGRIGSAGEDSGFFKGMWGRVIGKDYSSQSAQSSAFGDTTSDGRLGGLQRGADIYRAVAGSGARTSVGLFAGHMWSSSSDVSLAGPARSAGSTVSEGFVLGGYVTHVGASGWYVDALVQRDWIDHRIAGQDGARALTQSHATLASIEAGKAFGTVWKLEPQAQLI